jgi:hypothetical protein
MKTKSCRPSFLTPWGLFLLFYAWVIPCPLPATTSYQTTSNQTAANQEKKLAQDDATVQVAEEKFDGEAAFKILEEVCAIGSRVGTSEGMKKQQALITKHFEALGAKVALQRFQVNHPLSGQQVELANLCVRFHPERRKRLLMACHYDTRPFPDSDPVNPRGLFIGANDGASGVGLLAELGRHIAKMEGKFGVDIVFFDGEEFVWVPKRDPMFLGSEFFSRNYASGQWDCKYEFGILVDMVADKDLQIYYEGNSFEMAPRITKSIWAVAGQMGATEFIPKIRHQIRDDHLPLNQIAKIQTCDIIDFDYPNEAAGNIYWHTEADVPENCSAESMEKVGRVLLEWLRQLQKL